VSEFVSDLGLMHYEPIRCNGGSLVLVATSTRNPRDVKVGAVREGVSVWRSEVGE
jgi:hypothetical protein